MGKRGNEGSHRYDGLTVTGGFEAGQITIGPNGSVNPTYPNVFTSLIAPGVFVPGSAQAFSANQAKGSRAIVPRDGVIVEVAVYISTNSGNLDVGIYDVAATSRNRLWSSGSTAGAGGTQYQTFTPNLAVTRGQMIDLVVAADNGTITLTSQQISSANMSTLPSASWLPAFTDTAGLVAGSTNARLAWAASTSFPLPNPLLESNMGTTTTPPMVYCRLDG